MSGGGAAVAGSEKGLGEFEERNALFQVKLLAQRVDNLGREKEALERSHEKLDSRLDRIEHALAVGWGILIVFPLLGTVLGFLFAYGKVIFGPWFKIIP